MRFTSWTIVLLLASLWGISAQTRQRMPIASGDPAQLTVRTWRIYYGDGTVITCQCQQGVERSAKQWLTAPTTNVQVVMVLFNETYRTWRTDRWVVLPYRHLFHGARGGGDYYWFDAQKREFGAGLVTDIPAGLPDGALKTGTMLTDQKFREVMQRAGDDETF